ncbi:hypothetical protein [Mycolicibacterium gadium]|uniref:hypothetical protein n=1 Tax=Mycolicibacterium gadium TaxID=1794 RepID=UPI0013D1E78E|nr:hypothetical protein [Mycolicibacterium gadium]
MNFSIRGMELNSDQRAALSEKVFVERPSRGLKLAKPLAKKDLRVLVIRDTNTVGLGGPVRADNAKEGCANRWVRFLLDIGVADRVRIDGGTYGFGRSIAYNVSSFNTLLVYSRTQDELATAESRLIGSALGAPFSAGGKRYTGRHWWGRESRGAIEPVTGTQADKLATAVGFEPFSSDETGTAVMILDPVLRSADPEQAMQFIAESITWHLWPKMVPVKRRRPMTFSVSWNGRDIPVPDPGRLQPLPGFIRSLQLLREDAPEGVTPDGVEIVTIAAQRPKTTLGKLALSKFAYRTRQQSASHTDDDAGDAIPVQASPFTGQSHHVVLLRKPELVVSYMPGPSLPDGDLQWGGVFMAALEHNEAFSRAEPPTHDSWEPETVEDRTQRRIVNIALRQISSHVNQVYRPPATETSSSGKSVVRVANALAPLFSGISGQGGSSGSGGGSSGSPAGRRDRPRVHIESAKPLLHNDVRASEIRFKVTPSAKSSVTIVDITVDVAVGDRGVNEGKNRPVGAPVPSILEVEGPLTVTIHDADGCPLTSAAGERAITLVIDSTEETEWRVLSTAPNETAVAFTVEADPESRTASAEASL